MNARTKVSPTYQKKLLEHFDGDMTKAAAEMGCHPSTISRCMRDGESSYKLEQQAKRAFEKLHADAPVEQVVDETEKSAENMFLAVVPSEKLSQFSKVAGLMGVELVEV